MLYKDLVEDIEFFIDDNNLDRDKIKVNLFIEGDFEFRNLDCAIAESGFNYFVEDDELYICANLWDVLEEGDND